VYLYRERNWTVLGKLIERLDSYQRQKKFEELAETL
jgi:hypothetical protein